MLKKGDLVVGPFDSANMDGTWPQTTPGIKMKYGPGLGRCTSDERDGKVNVKVLHARRMSGSYHTYDLAKVPEHPSVSKAEQAKLVALRGAQAILRRALSECEREISEAQR